MPQIVFSFTRNRILMLSSVLVNLAKANDEQVCSCNGNVILCQVCLLSKYKFEKATV